uniref:NADH dehydrogenase subunit 2 n=1 Tax=Pleurostomum flabellatum TaxID=405751 RepID=A0A7T0Q5W5_9EUKA|nr:NADH dehydrogenase subunit 2 [Pleurostomum flabellatum]QPL15596.1 NADH dehydrogenase subunit 2 [Pleurostomum flabellatum]
MFSDAVFFFPESLILFFAFVFFLFAVFKNEIDLKSNLFFYKGMFCFFFMSGIIFLYESFFFEFGMQDIIFKSTFGNGLQLFLFYLVITYVFVILRILYQEQYRILEFLIFLFMSWYGIFMVFSLKNFLFLYIVLELVSFGFYLLTAYNRKKLFSLESGFKYFVLSSFSSMFMLLGISLVYGFLGNLSISDLSLYTSTLNILGNSAVDNFYVLCMFSFLCILVGISFKLYVFPFHFWVSDIYQGSMIASAFLFSIISILPFFVFLNVLYEGYTVLFFSNNSYYIFFFLSLGSMFVGSIAAVQQMMVRRTLAYSSVSTVGYYFTYFLYPDFVMIRDVIFFIIIYITTLLGFWLIYLNCKHLNSNTFIEQIQSFSNFVNYNRLFSCIILFFMLSLGGIPPFPSFFAKLYLLSDLIFREMFIVVALFLLITLISFFFYLRIGKFAVFFYKKNWEFFSNSIYLNSFLCLFVTGLNGFILFYASDILITCEFLLSI